MQKLVLVKYHGIIKSYDENGKPRMRQKYDAGGGLTLLLGQISHPILYSEAMRLKRDFGDAFEIIHSVDIPETQEEALEVEKNLDWAVDELQEIAVEDSVATQVTEDNGIFVSFKPKIDEADNQVIVKRSFDKTEKGFSNDYPEKLSKSKLQQMRKKDLAKLYRKWARALKKKTTLDKSAIKNDYIAEILIFQMAV